MPSLSSLNFYGELFGFDVNNALSVKKHLCDDDLCKKYFYRQEFEKERSAEEEKEDFEERRVLLPSGRNRSHQKHASAARMIAARLQGTEKNRMIRWQ